MSEAAKFAASLSDAASEFYSLRARLVEAERLLRLAVDHIPNEWVYWRDDYHRFVGEQRPAVNGKGSPDAP